MKPMILFIQPCMHHGLAGSVGELQLKHGIQTPTCSVCKQYTVQQSVPAASCTAV